MKIVCSHPPPPPNLCVSTPLFCSASPILPQMPLNHRTISLLARNKNIPGFLFGFLKQCFPEDINKSSAEISLKSAASGSSNILPAEFFLFISFLSLKLVTHFQHRTTFVDQQMLNRVSPA